MKKFPLDKPQAQFPYSARLAQEQGWSLGYAARVGDEYKRFMLLAATAGHPVTPSEHVDAAWHLHMIYTRSYWQEFCRDTLGKEIHHEPTQGGMSEDEKFHDWYAKTLESYQSLFQEYPPTDIWPCVNERFTASAGRRWMEKSTHFLLPKPSYIIKTLLSLFRKS